MKKDIFAIARARQAMKETAKAHGVSYAEVYREIQASIDEAWDTDDLAAMKLQREMFPDGKPTPEELFIALKRNV